MALQYDQKKKVMKVDEGNTKKVGSNVATGTASKPVTVDTGTRNATTQSTGVKAFTSNTPMLQGYDAVPSQTTKAVTPTAQKVVTPVQTAVQTQVADNTPTIMQVASANQINTPVVSSPTYSSSAVKPTYSSSAVKPTYESSYSEGNTYTPQTYEASSYSGMGFSGRSYKGKTFDAKTFEPSQEYYDAWEETKRMLEDLKSGRTSYSDKVDAKLAEIENKPKFEYDFNKDPLFQNMLNSYMRKGQVAMQDTMGQAAALTGGYGSSYAQSVGNQSYNQLVQEAYDNLPDYYQMAFQEYQADLQNAYNLLDEYRASDESEYNRKQNAYANQSQLTSDLFNREYAKADFDESSRQWAEGQTEASRQWAESLTESSAQHAESLSAQTSMHAQSLSEQSKQWAAEMNQSEQRYAQQLAAQKEAQEYERYRDAMGDYYRDVSLEYERYRDELADYYADRNFDYNAYRDSVADQKYANEFAYQQERDAVSDAKWQTQYDRSVYESDRDYGLSAAKYANSLSQWEQEFNYQKERDAISDQRYEDELKAEEAKLASSNKTATSKDISKIENTLKSAVEKYGADSDEVRSFILDWEDEGYNANTLLNMAKLYDTEPSTYIDDHGDVINSRTNQVVQYNEDARYYLVNDDDDPDKKIYKRVNGTDELTETQLKGIYGTKKYKNYIRTNK